MTKPIPEFPKAGGAYFIGRGRIIFEPPNKIEQSELKRYTDRERFNDPFKEVFIRFNDDTRQIFEPLMQPVSEGGEEAANKLINLAKECEEAGCFALVFVPFADFGRTVAGRIQGFRRH